MEKDQRLIDGYTLAHQYSMQLYRDVLDAHPYARLEEPVHWLAEEIVSVVTGNAAAPAQSFDTLVLAQSTQQALEEGDVFFTDLFDRNGLIPEKAQDRSIQDPLSDVLKTLYTIFFDLERHSSADLWVYHELQAHFEKELGRHLATHPALTSFDHWMAIYRLMGGQYDCFRAWIKAIPQQVIEETFPELLIRVSDRPFHELGYQMSHRQNPEAASAAYAQNLEQLKKASDWTYVWEATRWSDMVDLHEEANLCQHLVARLDLKKWLEWVDRLHWPLLQDHTFYFIQRVDDLEELIALIARRKVTLMSLPERILLMALKHYFSGLIKISQNLYGQKGDQWTYHDTEVRKLIRQQGEQDYEQWMNHDLQASCQKVWEAVFDTGPVSCSSYFEGVMEWMGSINKANYSRGGMVDVSYKVIDAVTDSFQERLNRDVDHKMDMVKNWPLKKINWPVLERWVGILEADDADMVFRQLLFDRHLEFLDSDDFQWNLSLEVSQVYIDQAANLAFVMLGLPDPLPAWEQLFATYRCHYEGWVITKSHLYQPRRKEAFVLTVGACMGYLFYKKEQTDLAWDTTQRVLNHTLAQGRSDASMLKEDGRVPLEMICSTIGQWDTTRVDQLAQTLTSQLDGEESWLESLYTLMEELSHQPFSFNATTRHVIRQRINENFQWLEASYQKHRSSQLKPYEQRRDAILEFLDP